MGPHQGLSITFFCPRCSCSPHLWIKIVFSPHHCCAKRAHLKKNNALITIDNLKTLSFFFYYSTNSQRMPVVIEFGPYFVVCHSSPPAGPFLCFRFRFFSQQANKGTGLKTRWVSASQSNTDPTPLQWQQHRWVNILTQYRPVQIVIWS